MVYSVIFAILDAVLSYAAVSYLFSAFSPLRKIVFSPFHILALAVCMVCDLVSVPTPVSIASVFVISLIIAIPYKMKWYNSIFVSLFSVVLNFASEMIVGVTMMAVFSMTFDNTVTGLAFFIGLILSRFVAYSITYAIKLARHKLFHKHFNIKWLLLFVLPIATTLVCMIIYGNVQTGQTQQSDLGILIVLTLLVLSNIFVFYIIDDMHNAILNKEKLDLAQELIRQQEKQYLDLISNNQEIRKLRHDYKNFLLGAMTEIQQGNTDAVKEAFGEELKMLTIPSFVQSGNSAFDAFLNYKIADAQKNGVRFDCSFQKMQDIDFSNIDLAVLIGNAMDNAIEAAVQIDDAEKRIIEFSAGINHEQFTVRILNPTAKPVDIRNLNTDKKDTDRHGFGILSMTQIAKKYGGEIVFNYADGQFETIIYLAVPELLQNRD